MRQHSASVGQIGSAYLALGEAYLQASKTTYNQAKQGRFPTGTGRFREKQNGRNAGRKSGGTPRPLVHPLSPG
jgi:hypothetical protein